MIKRLFFSMCGVLALSFVGCTNDDDDNNNNNNNATAVPTLGAQIDRQARPAANTALNQTFEADGGTAGAGKDVYNRAAPGTWPSFAPEIAKNLAIYDALDRNCGNQLAAGTTADAGRYDTLAAVLADDRLYLDTSRTTCLQYLAVEGNAVGLTNTDCGGRSPAMDVIDTTYSVLATGELTGVTDNVDADADGATHSETEFPFLAEPQ